MADSIDLFDFGLHLFNEPIVVIVLFLEAGRQFSFGLCFALG
jgi:hypothetical protein